MGLEVQIANPASLPGCEPAAGGQPRRVALCSVVGDPFGHWARGHKKIFSFIVGETISIRYTPEPGDKSTKIVFIQVMRELLDGVVSLPSVLDPDFAYQDPDTTPVDKFHVDYVTGEADPYYNGDDAQDPGRQGNAVSTPTRSARMRDTPRYLDGTFPAGKSKMKYEFRTAAFSAAGKDQGSYYRYVDWSYEKEKGKKSKLKIGSSGSDPGMKFTAAVDLWCKNHGFVLPTPPDPGTEPEETTYVVVSGDWLSKIAQRFYGDPGLWPRIYQANKAVIGPDPNKIYPGQELVIPD
ncbi:MAG: LysM peptidoglycan-binding domain-containing protein [Gemmataceae bacterium]|nr:LysM peptidoglycan-binding domain-containing protein [Gemmataceae bacterium]